MEIVRDRIITNIPISYEVSGLTFRTLHLSDGQLVAWLKKNSCILYPREKTFMQ